MEAHVFCGPEFVLAIPEEQLSEVLSHSPDVHDGESPSAGKFSGELRADVLQVMQTDIFNVLTPHLRRRLYHDFAHAPPPVPSAATNPPHSDESFAQLDRQQRRKRMTSSSLTLPRHQGAVPSPPQSLKFIEPCIRYPRVFKPRLSKSEGPGETVDDGVVATPSPAEGLSAVMGRPPALVPTSPEEEELLLNSVRVLTSQRASSSGSAQSSTVALSAALAAAAAPSASSPGGSPAVHFFLLYVCDSRVAAELYMLCLANFHISLSYGGKLYAVFARTAKAAPTVLEDVLSKRQVLKAHSNMDSDLHEVMTTRLTDTFIEGVLQAHAKSRDGGQSAGLLTSEERHQRHVEAILQYCEEKVQYAGVLDNDGEASAFLLAMGLVLSLELTPQDLLRHFLPHPRRIVRAVALFVARYLFPPEDLAPFFATSVTDAVVIACTEDLSVTTSLQELSTQLLEKDEVNEAWLPGAGPWKRYWLPKVVIPMEADLQRYALEAKQERERRLAAATGASVDDTAQAGHPTGSAASPSRATAATTTAHDSLSGAGRGIGAFGFRKLTDLVMFAKQKERNVAHENLKRRFEQLRRGDLMSTDGGAGTRKRPRDGETAADGDDWELVMQERDDDDDFLINVEVEGDEDDAFGGEGRHPGASAAASAPNGLVGDAGDRLAATTARDGGRVDAGPSLAQRQKERLTARQTAMKEGYALALSLLGRTQPFQRDERYLEF